jgi:hypothetical protein
MLLPCPVPLYPVQSAILYTVSGGLGTAGATLALIPAAIGLVTGGWVGE